MTLNKPITLSLAALALGISHLGAVENKTLPTVTVTASSDDIIAPDTLVGPYNQPEWTEHRRFTTTRVYLQQEAGEIGFEQWWRARSYDDKDPAHRFSSELEIGLPHRFQLDLYLNLANSDGSFHFDEFAVEMRYAFADWGVIPFNPTLYVEYAFVNHDFGGDTLESKILFGDSIGKNWQWGLNFIYEVELSHERANEFATSFGLSYSISKSFGAGVEMQYKRETVAGSRHDPEVQFEIGPSFQWRPSQNTHLDLVALFGTTNQGPRMESFIIFGWDFGGSSGSSGSSDKKDDHRYSPVSMHQN